MHSVAVSRPLAIILTVLLLLSFTACIIGESNGPATDSSDEGSEDNAQTYDLTITKTGSGSGTVISIPAAIDCGAATAMTRDRS
jgi:hypothetical protein